MKPIVYMLCGLPGSGKTTWAKKVEAQGVRRIAIDEAVFEKHGRYGQDYSEEQYREFEKHVVASLEQLLLLFLESGRPVILDFGFWGKKNREKYKKLIEENDGQWKLLYFKAEPPTLMRRLQARSRRSDANALPVTREMLLSFVEEFEEPVGEGEEVFLQGQT